MVKQTQVHHVRRRYTIIMLMALSGIVSGLVGLVLLTRLIPDEVVLSQAVFSDALAPNTLGIGALYASAYLLLACILSTKTARKKPEHHDPEHLIGIPDIKEGITLQSILMAEFEYARETAAQAMEERRSVTNFYLLIVGGTISGVIALLSTLASHHNLLLGAVAALWLVCITGLLMSFSIISLRLAWVISANSMNHVKEFYLQNADKLGASRDILQSAFTYRTSTIPPAETHWNVTHFASLLIGSLDAGAFLSGLMLIGLALSEHGLPLICVIGGALAIFVFMAHWWSYDLSLTPKQGA